MNPVSEDEKYPPAAGTPVWLRRILLALLFLSVVSGLAWGILIIRHSTAGPADGFREKPATETKLSDLRTFFEKKEVSQPAKEIVCQGMILMATRGARVIINGKSVKTGAVVDGAKVLEITASNVLVECNGETRRLAPGESFIPNRH